MEWEITVYLEHFACMVESVIHRTPIRLIAMQSHP
jgi:hypothetical protein